MTSPYKAMCAELLLFSEEAGEICMNESLWPKSDPNCTLLDRARALLAQEPQPVPDAVVAEMITLLRAEADADDKNNHAHWLSSVDMHYIADLLQRLTSDNAGLEAAAESAYFDNLSLLCGQND